MLDITPLDHKEVKRVNKYEVLYIVTPELEDEAIKAVIEKFSGIIAANGGEVEQVMSGAVKSLLTPSTIRPKVTMCWWILPQTPNCPGSWSGISRTTNPFCVTWLPARKPKAFVTPAYHTAQERMARQG